jgi:hypothetical protein
MYTISAVNAQWLNNHWITNYYNIAETELDVKEVIIEDEVKLM